MGGGGAMVVPLKFSVVTEKTVRITSVENFSFIFIVFFFLCRIW